MTDTVRTKSELIALLASNNNTRAISAQKIRDFIVSIYDQVEHGNRPDSLLWSSIENDFYVDPGVVGDDANDGLTDGTPVKTWARLVEILPPAYIGPLRIRHVGSESLMLPALVRLPVPVGNAPPIQIVGSYDQTGGTRVVAGIGTDTIEVDGGGLMPDEFRGMVARRTGGSGTWRRYYITGNSTTELVIALPWVNGDAPHVDDTFVIESAVAPFDWDEVVIDLNGATVIIDGVLFNGAGAGVKRLTFVDGTLYPQGCRVYANGGRFGFDNCSCRTVDLVESTFDGVSRYPTEMPDLLGLFVSGGDFYADGTSKHSLVMVTGTESFQSGTPPFPSAPIANFDATCRDGSKVFFLDSNVSSDSACGPGEGGTMVFTRSDDTNSRSKLTTTNAGNMAYDGGLLILDRTDISGCTTPSGIADGVLADSGGLVLVSNCTSDGVANTGYGMRQQRGGDLVELSNGASTLTGLLGDVGISVPGVGSVARTWEEFQTQLLTTRRCPILDYMIPDDAEIQLHKLDSLFNLAPNVGDGPIVWFRADFERVDDTNVKTIKDATFRRYAPTQAVGAAQPAYVVQDAAANFMDGLDFDGADDRLVIPSGFTSLASTGLTVFYVARFNDTAAGQYVARSASAFDSFQLTGERYFTIGGGDGRVADITTTPAIWTMLFDGSLSGNANRLKVWKNAVAKTLSFGVAIPASIAGTGALTLGAYNDVPNYPFNGRLYELIIYPRTLPTTEREHVYEYLAARYAL